MMHVTSLIFEVLNMNCVYNFCIFSQVSNLCPREYPEFLEIRVFSFDNQNPENERTFPVSVSEKAILTVEDAFTLDSNERYRAKIFFNSPAGGFNISKSVNISECLHVETILKAHLS